MSEPPGDTTTATAPRYQRRLSDKVLVAFHQACDQNDVAVATALLSVLEFAVYSSVGRGKTERRRDQKGLLAAHERLWHLTHPKI
jgi:hypothetical protein